MKTREKWLRTLIREFNKRWGLELHISRIIFWERDHAEYVEASKDRGWIKINKKKTRYEMAEDLYHELGHAIIHQYGIKRKSLSVFRDSSPKISFAVFSKRKYEQKMSPPKGFVSWYSQINGTEDFCEVLSAWVSSHYRTNGPIAYDGHCFNLKKDLKLKRKILAVKKILEE